MAATIRICVDARTREAITEAKQAYADEHLGGDDIDLVTDNFIVRRMAYRYLGRL
ncbi:MAG TPA: hypothetical protein VII92_14755 [Anaerolineae bacterium]